ncbi:hypothetical protein, partial [Clostridium perfringens]
MTDTATAKYCRGCGTLMLNCGAPIWEDYCPNEKCDWDKNVFRRAVLSAHPSQMPQDVISL